MDIRKRRGETGSATLPPTSSFDSILGKLSGEAIVIYQIVLLLANAEICCEISKMQVTEMYQNVQTEFWYYKDSITKPDSSHVASYVLDPTGS